MVEKLYYVLFVSVVLFIGAYIIMDQLNRRERKNKVIIKFRKGIDSYFIILGFIWFMFFAVFSYIFFYRAQEVYYSLGKEYINNVFQLFDVGYLKTLRKYFYENAMLSELNRISFYQSELLNMLIWLISSCCISIINFYQAWRPVEIVKDGIVYSGKFINSESISGYRRGNLHEKKWFSKEFKYYDYFITLKRKKVLSNSYVEHEVKVYVSYGREDFVDSIFKDFNLSF